MGLLDGKKGLVFGIANDRSYASFITRSLVEQGATCGFTHLPDADPARGKMRKRCASAVEELGLKDPWLVPCDVTKDEDLDAVFAKVKQDFGSIDFIVHSVAFADRQFLQIGNFHTTTREAWQQALDISAYSLLALGQRAVDVMPDGGSIVAMSYYGGEKVIPGYNIMGVAKAALEHTTRYLAA
ncbi:MAG: SDR family oxidoreductase, partial [Phycisphaeraceae bacterium]